MTTHPSPLIVDTVEKTLSAGGFAILAIGNDDLDYVQWMIDPDGHTTLEVSDPSLYGGAPRSSAQLSALAAIGFESDDAPNFHLSVDRPDSTELSEMIQLAIDDVFPGDRETVSLANIALDS